MASLVVYVDGGRSLFVMLLNPQCNQDFNETIKETFNMPEKALKMLLNISGNVSPAAGLS